MILWPTSRSFRTMSVDRRPTQQLRFETLEQRLPPASDIAVYTMPFESETRFNQFTGGDPIAFGVGIDDPLAGSLVDKQPGFIGFDTGSRDWGIPYDFGLVWGRAGVRFNARMGIEYGYYVNGGTAVVQRDGDVSVTVKETETGATIDVDATTLNGYLYTISPKISAYADLVMKLRADAYGSASFPLDPSSPYSLNENLLNIDEKINLFSINRQVVDANGHAIFDNNGAPIFDGKIKYVGQDIIGSVTDAAEGLKDAYDDIRQSEIDKESAKRKQKTARTNEELDQANADYNQAVANEQNAKQRKQDIDADSADDDDGKLQGGAGLTLSFGQAEGSLLGLQMDVGLGGSAGPFELETYLGSLAVTMPDINLTDLVPDPDGRMGADTRDFEPGSEEDARRQLANIELDIAGLIGASLGLGKISFDLGGVVSGELTTISYIISTLLNFNQAVAVEPTNKTMTFNFVNSSSGNPIAVDVLLDGQRIDDVTSLAFSPEQDVEIIPNSSQAIRVEPSYVENYQFKNDIGLDIDVNGTLEILRLSMEAIGIELFDVGPLYKLTHDIASFDLGSIYNTSFPIAPTTVLLDSFLVGGIRTDFEATLAATPFMSSQVGQPRDIAYNIRLTNNGPHTGTQAIVALTLPTGVNFVAVGTTPGYSINGRVVTYTLNNLAATTLQSITINALAVNPQANDYLLATVDVTTPDRDLDLTNNATSQGTRVTAPIVYFVEFPGDTAPGSAVIPGMRSLRQAIEAANASPGIDYIRISPARSGSLDVRLDYGELVVTDSLTIHGLFHINRTSTMAASRLIRFGGAGVKQYKLINATLSGGDSNGENGGAIYLNDPDDQLTLESVDINNSTARNGWGGALYVNGSSLTVLNSGFVGNTADYGGAVEIGNETLNSATFSRVVFAENIATSGGGAVDLSSFGSGQKILASFTDSVFADNRAPKGAAVELYSEGTPVPVTFTRNIFARNAGSGNIEGYGSPNDLTNVTSGGGNVSDDNTGPNTASGDRRDTDPQLSELNYRLDLGGLPYFEVYRDSQTAMLNPKAVRVVTDERTDLQALSFTHGPSLTDLRLGYRVTRNQTSSFAIRLYTSTDQQSLQNAVPIGNPISVLNPDELTIGEHEITVNDPAVLNAIMNRDHRFIVAVLDGNNEHREHREDNNIIGFTGVLHTLSGGRGPVMVRGSDSANGAAQFIDETITMSVNGSNLQITGVGAAGNVPLSSVTGLTILGHSGNDVITVASEVKVPAFIDGGAGQDSIQSGSGHDTLFGGRGNDTIRGGAGNDTVWGRAGLDPVTGLARPLDSGSNNDLDHLDGEAGNDVLSGEVGADSLVGGDGRDRLNGNDGHDTLIGGTGIDSLSGGAGNDHLVGGEMLVNDRVLDVFVGNDGTDRLVGSYDVLDRMTETARIAAGIELDRRPVIASVTGPEAKTYGANQSLNFTINFAQPVVVTGSPRLQVTVGSRTYYATYVGLAGNANATQQFRLVVPNNTVDSNGITMRSSIILPRGTRIVDTQGQAVNVSFVPPRLVGVRIDSRLPRVTSIRPTNFDTNTRIATFTVIFSKAIAGIGNDDFDLVRTGTLSDASIQSVTGEGNQYQVQVQIGSGRGTVRLRLQDDNTIVDLVGNPLGGAGNDNGDYLLGPVLKVI